MDEFTQQLVNGKVIDATLQLDSLLNILDVYIESNSDIEEMVHASVIIEKMHEEINVIKTFIEYYNMT